jgi:hypothetical protein
MSDQQLAFKTALANYHKAERDRAEECLRDIGKILDIEGKPDAVAVEQIMARLVDHYSRPQ